MISAERLNIVYRGLPNPIKIALPGAKSFIATAPGLAKDSVGNYRLFPGAGNEVKIEIYAIMQDNSKLHEEKIFRIKGIPATIGTINGETGGKYVFKMSKENLKNAIVGFELKNFTFIDTNADFYKVKSFTIKIGNEEYDINGNKITSDINKVISESKSGTLVIITRIINGEWH